MSLSDRKPSVLDWLTASTDKANFRSLSLFRIVFATLLIFDYTMNIGDDYQAFFTDEGILPTSLWYQLYRDFGVFSILPWSDLPLYHFIIRTVYICALFAFLAGYKTRLSNFIILVIFVSIYWRNTFILCNVEALVRALLVFSLFLPLNRYWSIDAALEIQDRNRPTPLIPLVCIKIQIAIIYLFAGLSKLETFDGHISDWVNGVAIGRALLDSTTASPWGRQLVLHYPDLTVIGTHIVPWFQILFTPLVYSPWNNGLTRFLAIAGAFMLHFSFILFLNVGFFPVYCISYLILIVPDSWWTSLSKKRAHRLGHIKIFYDSDCGFCKKTALLLREFCLNEKTSVSPSKSDMKADEILKRDNTWVVFGECGEIYTKWIAVSYVLKRSFVFFPIGYLTDIYFLRSTMEKFYALIGNSRGALGKFSGSLLPWRQERNIPSWACAVCLATTFFMIQYGFMALPQVSRTSMPPTWLQTIVRALQVEQSWAVFAPDPISSNKKINIQVLLTDGQKIDINNIVSKPFSHSSDSANFRQSLRWRVFMSHLPQAGPVIQDLFMQYLCRVSNESLSKENKKASSISIYYTMAPVTFPVHENENPLPMVFIDRTSSCS